MGGRIVEGLVARVSFIHGAFLEGVEGLDEESFHARPAAKAPSIAFHLWHTARWADAFQARLGSFAPQLARFAGREQLWEVRELASAWGLGDMLGKEGTGAGLDDDASATLPLPGKEQVVAYAREAFAEAEDVFRGFDDDELLLPSADFYDEGEWIVLGPLRLAPHACLPPPGDDRGAEGSPRRRGHCNSLNECAGQHIHCTGWNTWSS